MPKSSLQPGAGGIIHRLIFSICVYFWGHDAPDAAGFGKSPFSSVCQRKLGEDCEVLGSTRTYALLLLLSFFLSSFELRLSHRDAAGNPLVQNTEKRGKENVREVK